MERNKGRRQPQPLPLATEHHSPQDHHIEGIVGHAGDQGSEGDEEDGGEQEVGAGDGAGPCFRRSRASSHTAAVQVDL